MPRRLFCSKPFTWFEVSGWYEPKGDVFLCCPTWLERPIGNLQRQSVDEVWNGPEAQEIRRSILDGTFEHCNGARCPFLQTISGPVQHADEVTDPELQNAIANRLTVLPYGPREINCTFDKSCNLSCPSCRTALIVERKSERQIRGIQERLHADALGDAQLIYITGSGDPFGSPFFHEWLRTMDVNRMPNLRNIHLHTNALLWTPGTWDRIPERTRQLVRSSEISIDAATPGTYAVNRRGGDFERLLQNLEFISRLRRDGPLASVTVSMVVQANNFREMPGFVALGKRFGFDTVYFSQLVNWGTFSDGEFRRRAVHLAGHPRRAELIDLLQDAVFDDPVVNLGNLTQVRRTA